MLTPNIHALCLFPEKITALPMFLDNGIDGSLLMNDDLDDAWLNVLIPQAKHRIIFNDELMKLK